MTLATDLATHSRSSSERTYSLFDKKKRIIAELREAWGHSSDRRRNFERIGLYHHLARTHGEEATVDDQTWVDLNLDDVFAKIDRTITSLGSQYLYHLLHTYEEDETILRRRSELCGLFMKNSEFRESVQVILTKLNQRDGYSLPKILLGDIPDRPRWYWIIYILSALSILSLVITFFHPAIFWIALGMALINITLNFRFGSRSLAYFSDLSSLSTLLRVADVLAEPKQAGTEYPFESLRKHRALARSLNRKIGWLILDSSRMDTLSATFVEYLNQFCLFNLVAWMRTSHSIRQWQSELRQIFDAVAALDTSIAVASYLTEAKCFCAPCFTKSSVIDFSDVTHPLVENPVPNSITLDKKSCLVTGSNMAGKTTFVKTLGVNVILAQTLHFCLATKASVPKLFVKSSINRSDDINNRKSRYFQEIETVLKFTKLGSAPHQYLFIIDEIFSGTNTVERISAAASVLDYLGKNNVTLVTTHDLELQELLRSRYVVYHFTEQVVGNRHFFDYKLKAGPCLTRNAIKLLGLLGYPSEIIRRSNALARKLS